MDDFSPKNWKQTKIFEPVCKGMNLGLFCAFPLSGLSATIWPNDGMQVFGTSVLASFWRFGLPAKF